MFRNRYFCAAALFLLTAASILYGHAILTKSSPAPNATVSGHSLPVSLTFNSKIDAARSKIDLVSPDKVHHALSISNADTPNVLKSSASDLQPGAYQLQWQVLAIDGHITRGGIPFTVK